MTTRMSVKTLDELFSMRVSVRVEYTDAFNLSKKVYEPDACSVAELDSELHLNFSGLFDETDEDSNDPVEILTEALFRKGASDPSVGEVNSVMVQFLKEPKKRGS